MTTIFNISLESKYDFTKFHFPYANEITDWVFSLGEVARGSPWGHRSNVPFYSQFVGKQTLLSSPSKQTDCCS